MSKASRLKGHCNRLYAIFELPAHQAKTWWRFFLVLGEGVVSAVCVVSFFLLFFCRQFWECLRPLQLLLLRPCLQTLPAKLLPQQIS